LNKNGLRQNAPISAEATRLHRVDQDGNFYTAEVDNGRVQKFAPKAGANPDFLVAKPIYSAWK
jgi:hypothetical protein